MRRLSLNFKIVYLLLIIAAAAATFWSPPTPARSALAVTSHETHRASLDTGSKKTVTHEGASVTYDTALASEIKAATVPATPLEQASDKPDGVYPQHIAFTLSGMNLPSSSIEPVIRVCPVKEFKQAFSVSTQYVKAAEEVFLKLRRVLRTHPAAFNGETLSLPFPDAHDAFRARTKYLRFKNGAGVIYLTQRQQDESSINNRQMSYVFYGLTDDRRDYVSAEFPVAVPLLPGSSDVNRFENYELPRSFYGTDGKLRLRQYRAYVEKIKFRLNRTPSEKFQPSLDLYDELMSSLEVKR